ncbi:hypothetical protein HD554DRAFT_1605663 [Boletus coccyginus]|nr:hypothetical protein HD554DRAFT_1605663 [Boletus coccyginus]
MSFFLCVDCGGSKTSAVIANRDGNIVGRALGGPSNFAYMSATDFQHAIQTAVSNALKTCISPPATEPVPLPVAPGVFASAWFGISGVDSPAAARNAAAAIAPLINLPLGPQLTVANDTHLLAAPLQLHQDIAHAVAVIAGTGSCVVSFTRGASGSLVELARTGGWGWILGDEGGGFHVGRETMRLMMHDLACSSLGMTPTPRSKLKEKVLARFGITGEENAAEVLPVIHIPEPHPQNASASESAPKVPAYHQVAREKRLSQLSPLVFEAAFKEGDEFALRVLRSCAGALADQIAMLCLTPGEGVVLKPRGVKPEDAILCFGGSLVGVEAYRELVLDELKKRGCIFRYVEFVEDAAAVGAVGLAKSLEYLP